MAHTDSEQSMPAPPPRTSAGGRQPGGAGTFLGRPYIDYGLCPLLARHGLGTAEILAVVIALCAAKRDGDRWALTWAEDECERRSTVSARAVRRAKQKLIKAGLITCSTPAKKGRAAIWDVTELLNAKGK